MFDVSKRIYGINWSFIRILAVRVLDGFFFVSVFKVIFVVVCLVCFNVEKKAGFLNIFLLKLIVVLNRGEWFGFLRIYVYDGRLK